MISPSVRNSRRSTPCVLGCCGPMLTSISSVRTSNSTTRGSSKVRLMVIFLVRRGRIHPAGGVTIAAVGTTAGMRLRERRLSAADAVIFQRHVIIFAERMTLPIFRTEDAAKIRVIGEVHADQVVAF